MEEDKRPAKSNLKAQREAVNIYYVYHFPIFVFIIQLAGLIFVALIYALIIIYLNDFSLSLSTAEKSRNLHLILAPLSFVFITGEGILIFRICRNIKTWQVKVCHIILHCIGAILGIFGIVAMYLGKENAHKEETAYQKHQDEIKEDTGYGTIHVIYMDAIHLHSLHPAVGYFAAVSVILTFFTGILLMFIQLHSFWIDMWSELHGFLGIFTLITTSIAACCGIMTTLSDPVYFKLDSYYEFSVEYKIGFGAIATCLIFTWGIIYVVINPHFEWVKIGPI